MQKNRINNRGASLIEVLAIIVLSSLVLTTASNILRQNIRQNAMNQEKLIQSVVANSTLKYIKTIDYLSINDLIESDDYLLIDQSNYKYNCELLFPQDEETNNTETDNNRLGLCQASFKQMVNGKEYEPLTHVIIMPFNNIEVVEKMIDNNNLEEMPVLYNHLSQLLDARQDDNQSKANILQVIVVIESTIHERNDFILEGVITYEEYERSE